MAAVRTWAGAAGTAGTLPRRSLRDGGHHQGVHANLQMGIVVAGGRWVA
jgi:hypothetical protein